MRNMRKGISIVIATLLSFILCMGPHPMKVHADAEIFYVSSWSEMVDALSSSVSGNPIIYLQNDLTAGSNDSSLVFPDHVSHHLYSNGHTIDGSALTGQPVLTINGTLVIYRDNLTVTGGNNPSGNGGGIYVPGSLIVNGGLTVTDCSAAKGGGIYVGAFSGSALGSVRVNQNATLSLRNNTAEDGGGLYCDDRASFTLNGGNVSFDTNTASGNSTSAGHGGGMYIDSHASVSLYYEGTLAFNNCRAVGTTTEAGQGGGLYMPSVPSDTSVNASFTCNEAGEGGGLYCAGISGTGSNLEFVGNRAIGTDNYEGLGGGIYTAGEIYVGSMVLRNNTASGEAGGKGGGFYGEGQQLVVDSNLTATGNRAGSDTRIGKGGGIYARRLTTSGITTIYGNQAGSSSTEEGAGGGAYLSDRMNVEGIASIYGNTVLAAGGSQEANDLYFASSSTSPQIVLTGALAQDSRIGVAGINSSQTNPVNLVDWSRGSATSDNFFGDEAQMYILGPSGDTIETKDWDYVKDHLPSKRIMITITESDGKEEDVSENIDNLEDTLAEAIAKGGKQTVYWNEGTALPYSIMKTLQDNPDITLVFSYIYQGISYKVTIPGSTAKAYTSIPWYGPLYLNAYYGSSKASVKNTTASASAGTYVVKAGDTLSAIAARLHTSVKRLANVNNMADPDRLSIGQTIKY